MVELLKLHGSYMENPPVGMENKNLIVRRMHGNNRRSLFFHFSIVGTREEAV